MKAYHFLIVLLAFIDAVYCGLTVFAYYYDWKEGSYQLGSFGCEYGVPFAKFLFPLLSFWLVVFISHERYRNIVCPFGKKTTIRKYSVLSVLVFLISIGLTVAQKITLSSMLHGESGRENCYHMWHVTRSEFHATFLSVYALPLFIPIGFMLYYYTKISGHMKNEEKRALNTLSVANRIRQRNRKALNVVLLLIVIYAVTVIPARSYYYFWLNYVYFESMSVIIDWDWKIWVILEYFSYTLVLLNNVVNWIVYAAMMKDYRLFLRSVATFGLYRGKRQPRSIKSQLKNGLELQEQVKQEVQQ